MPRERAKERACDKAIRDTLSYRAVFNYPLTYYQLFNTLISKKSFAREFFDKELRKLVKNHTIGFRHGKYYEKKIKPVSWETRYKQSQKNVKKAKEVIKLLAKIPWIKMLAITGSVAAYNSDKEADIDIFIITQANRLWLTRGFVAAILKTAGLYIQNDKGPGKLCPNLFVDERAIAWTEDQQSLYTAHEILLCQPLIDRDNTYFKFLEKNIWIKNYFANFEYEAPTVNQKPNNHSNFAIKFVEKLAQKLQTFYMRKKLTTEVVTDKIIHFKKNDNAGWVLDSFANLVNVKHPK